MTNNTNETILNVPLSSIAVDLAWNARSGAWKRDSGFESESAFEELKESIRACGVKDPVKLRPVADGERPFALVSGFRRYGACEQLGFERIPAVVRAMTDADADRKRTREYGAVRLEAARSRVGRCRRCEARSFRHRYRARDRHDAAVRLEAAPNHERRRASRHRAMAIERMPRHRRRDAWLGEGAQGGAGRHVYATSSRHS